eukprot:7216615-Prorocentrum_lima.AAC.1
MTKRPQHGQATLGSAPESKVGVAPPGPESNSSPGQPSMGRAPHLYLGTVDRVLKVNRVLK